MKCERCGQEPKKHATASRDAQDAKAPRRVRCERCKRLVCKTCGFEESAGGGTRWGRCWEPCQEGDPKVV